MPWFTYPAIEFLSQLDLAGADVLEFGSGGGTQWWAARTRHVTAVESDEGWYRTLRAEMTDNVTLLLAPDEQAYVNAAEGTYDIVVIDGKYRDKCAARAAQVVRPDGLIVLDNAERYPEVTAALRDLGTQIDFIGPGPINPYAWSTSVFFMRRAGPPHRPQIELRASDRSRTRTIAGAHGLSRDASTR